ncbi:MAG TPA: YihY/virulence factor BrkB family protein [Candidatus Borkfalkia excrementavium]|uniref:YihY/virulence factor BrkB family protein n=1 Tax=Candidatus Borkfalkia excrementavium TaxID=2838505 RepID=A0A9D1Z716_9FIRM|nr:YihY/virulence factor BrkB family protein [Candidatus Borkfalkia excrementavium]
MTYFTDAIRKARSAYGYLAAKKYTTLAGTMAFFLVLSIVPFLFWLTLIFGKLNIDYEQFFELEIFTDIRDILFYIRDAAESATVGASVILLATTLYSSTNLFYHMRRSGEIIYEYKRKKGGIALRISALVLIFIVMLLLLAAAIVFLLGNAFLKRAFPSFFAQLGLYAILGVLAFFFIVLLNLYICPYRVGFYNVVWGSLLTLLLGGIASFGFTIYLRLGNMQKLYGAVALFIVFLLWLYLLMICFVIGVILNCYLVNQDQKIKKRHKKF